MIGLCLLHYVAGPVSSHFWQIQLRQNFWPYLADSSIVALHMDYLQLKVVKQVSACHRFSDVTV